MPIPVLFETKYDCCGCSACQQICSSNAITMTPDEEGFLYPMIDEKLCVGCHSCMSVCPVKKHECQ